MYRKIFFIKMIDHIDNSLNIDERSTIYINESDT